MESHIIKLAGRSGCPISIFESENTIVVRKVSSSFAYNKRLGIQSDKQKNFNLTGKIQSSFYAPEIIRSGIEESGLFCIDMEYVRGDKFSDYFSKINLAQINSIINSIEGFIRDCMSACQYNKLPFEIISNKVNELEEKLADNINFSNNLKARIFNYLLKEIPDAPIPIGTCHGDFTFSNMLFSATDRIYLFDFLDSFIESPIIDIVKIRQDTRFHWSVEIDDHLESYKKAKVIQILNYIDDKICVMTENFGNEFKLWYTYLEVFNLLRIMPYVTEQKDIKFLDKNINLLIPIR